jgi:hypothetical protein
MGDRPLPCPTLTALDQAKIPVATTVRAKAADGDPTRFEQVACKIRFGRRSAVPIPPANCSTDRDQLTISDFVAH